jgi:hypothetical protein
MPIKVNLIGRFGNVLFQYAHARKVAELNNTTLDAVKWWGEDIFEDCKYSGDSNYSQVIHGYFQNQESLIYTREDCKRWFKFKPHIKEMLDESHVKCKILAHLRRGDYGGYGYPKISETSYIDAVEKFGMWRNDVLFSMEEYPFKNARFDGDLQFLPDFYRMMKADVLFRANSSFSYWAAVLADSSQRIFSPVIDGIAGGEKEIECDFVEGNWPRLSNLDGITDLHLAEK